MTDYELSKEDVDGLNPVTTFLTYLAGFDNGEGEVKLIKRKDEHIVNFICNGPLGNVTLTWSPADDATLS